MCPVRSRQPMEQKARFGRYAVHGCATKDIRTQSFRIELQPKEQQIAGTLINRRVNAAVVR